MSARFRPQVRPIATDVAWSVCLCLLVTAMSCAKTAEPIEMLFGVRTFVGPKNHVLVPQGNGHLWGHLTARCKV